MSKKKSWIDLILYIIDFILGRNRHQRIENQKIEDDLKSEYDRIDNEKEAKKDEDLKDRLNNMF